MALSKIEQITRFLAVEPTPRDGWDSVELCGGPYDGCWMHVDLETDHMLLVVNVDITEWALYMMGIRQAADPDVTELYGEFSRYVDEFDPLVRSCEQYG